MLADPGDLGQGSVATKWNLSATPTMYVIDLKGVIRYKWLAAPGEKAIDAVLDKLIKEPQPRRTVNA
jgi:peroxiredoxin